MVMAELRSLVASNNFPTVGNQALPRLLSTYRLSPQESRAQQKCSVLLCMSAIKVYFFLPDSRKQHSVGEGAGHWPC